MHVNGGTEATSNAVDTPIITESLITRLATITCATDGAEIRYTTDGTRPDWRSTLYTAPVDTSGISQIRARGFKPGRTGSQIATASLGVDLTSENPETLADESGELTLGPE